MEFCQIDCMYSHGLRMLSMICCVSLLFFIPIIDSLLSLCTSVKPMQPKHEYACIAWHPVPLTVCLKLERMQRKL